MPSDETNPEWVEQRTCMRYFDQRVIDGRITLTVSASLRWTAEIKPQRFIILYTAEAMASADGTNIMAATHESLMDIEVEPLKAEFSKMSARDAQIVLAQVRAALGVPAPRPRVTCPHCNEVFAVSHACFVAGERLQDDSPGMTEAWKNNRLGAVETTDLHVQEIPEGGWCKRCDGYGSNAPPLPPCPACGVFHGHGRFLVNDDPRLRARHGDEALPQFLADMRTPDFTGCDPNLIDSASKSTEQKITISATGEQPNQLKDTGNINPTLMFRKSAPASLPVSLRDPKSVLCACTCPATSEYDPPCPRHGVLGIGVTGSTPSTVLPHGWRSQRDGNTTTLWVKMLSVERQAAILHHLWLPTGGRSSVLEVARNVPALVLQNWLVLALATRTEEHGL